MEIKRIEMKNMEYALEMKRLDVQLATREPVESGTNVIHDVPYEPEMITPSEEPIQPTETHANLREKIVIYIEETCDFDKYNQNYRMSSETMFIQFRNWNDERYGMEHMDKPIFKNIVNEITGMKTKVRINGHKISGWYGLRYKVPDA